MYRLKLEVEIRITVSHLDNEMGGSKKGRIMIPIGTILATMKKFFAS